MSTPTPHINANKNDFAPTVLMPGDPLRAKFIAENVKLINKVRGILGYVGYYKGHKISVMASGMGIPSICIYSYELYNFYNVQNIIRIGTAGAIDPDLQLFDIVIGSGACTDLNYSHLLGIDGIFAPIASYNLVFNAVEVTKELNLRFKVGNLLSSSMFYSENTETLQKWQSFGVLAVEMEAAGLYLNAAQAKKSALCICTISDIPTTGESLNSEQRQNNTETMVKIALNTAIKTEENENYKNPH